MAQNQYGVDYGQHAAGKAKFDEFASNMRQTFAALLDETGAEYQTMFGDHQVAFMQVHTKIDEDSRAATSIVNDMSSRFHSVGVAYANADEQGRQTLNSMAQTGQSSVNAASGIFGVA